MMDAATYAGVNAAVLTAMHEDLSIDIDRTAAHGRWLLENGCTGLAILGTTSEANSLGVQERIALMEGMVERGIPPARMLPGTGTTAISDTVILTRKAAELGCPGVLMLPPFFYKNPSDDGLFAYFSEVINQVGTGTKIYLYHFPAQSAVPFGLDLVARLLRAFPGTIAGVKDSSGDFANTKGYVDHFAKDGFEVYAGDDGTLLDTLKAGGAGCITAAANMGCAVSAQVVAHWQDSAGVAAQVQLAGIRRAVISAPLIPSLKALVARRTGDTGWETIRPPHLKLSPDAASRVFAAYDTVMAQPASAAA